MVQESPEIENPTQYFPQKDDSSIRFRLDPSKILYEIQKKLQGSYTEYVWVEGQLEKKEHTIGKKLLNDEGIQKVMTHASSIINQATVLGNFKDSNEKNRFFLFWKKNLRKELYINKYNYGIETSSAVNHILIVVSAFADLFLTRLIGRKEAESLEKTHNIVENVNQEPRKGLLGFR